MGLYCDACEGDLKLIKEDDDYYYYQCVDCKRVRKFKKLKESEHYE